MRFKARQRQDTDIDVTSFSDIAFLLIIFFILTTTFVKPEGRQLNIPSGTSDPAKKEQKQLTVILSPGEIRYGDQGRVVSLEQLREALQREKLPTRSEEQRIVVVEAKVNVPYDEYFQVVMAISRAGGVLGLLEAPATTVPAP
jgi:biopolymer transport protein ExbD